MGKITQELGVCDIDHRLPGDHRSNDRINRHGECKPIKHWGIGSEAIDMDWEGNSRDLCGYLQCVVPIVREGACAYLARCAPRRDPSADVLGRGFCSKGVGVNIFIEWHASVGVVWTATASILGSNSDDEDFLQVRNAQILDFGG